ncbi:hypothetical protein BsWGS_22693 [Bradybaena similaris]
MGLGLGKTNWAEVRSQPTWSDSSGAPGVIVCECGISLCDFNPATFSPRVMQRRGPRCGQTLIFYKRAAIDQNSTDLDSPYHPVLSSARRCRQHITSCTRH